MFHRHVLPRTRPEGESLHPLDLGPPMFRRSGSQPPPRWCRWQIPDLGGEDWHPKHPSRFRRISAAERRRRLPLEPSPMQQLTQVLCVVAYSHLTLLKLLAPHVPTPRLITRLPTLLSSLSRSFLLSGFFSCIYQLAGRNSSHWKLMSVCPEAKAGYVNLSSLLSGVHSPLLLPTQAALHRLEIC